VDAARHELLLYHPLALAGKIDNRRRLLTAPGGSKQPNNQKLRNSSHDKK
jgi:hypothetical protein